jgi:putative ABC transport system permease protein
MRAGVELAWLQLIKKKGHFAVAVSGVTFAVTLMFTQIGLLDALLNASIRLYRHIAADAVITSWDYRFQQGTALVPKRRIAEVLAVNGVEQCIPLQISPLVFENPETHEQHAIMVIGFPLEDGIWTFKDQSVDFHLLNVMGSAIYDSRSRAVFGPLPQMLSAHGPVRVIVARRSVDVVGVLALGPGFGNDGYLFTSDATHDALIPNSTQPMAGMIRFKPHADRERVLRDLREILPADVRVTAYDQFLQDEKDYWVRRTPTGIIFTATLFLGVVVGGVVVYQILYSDVMNHLPEYATMKAMGYSDRKLFRVVMIQAICMSIIGFIPGLLIAAVIFLLLEKITFLPLAMTLTRIGEVYALTLFMCAAAGATAMRALRAADPAEIF